MLSHSLVRGCEVTHQEFLWNINLNTLANVGAQGELTHFMRGVISRQFVVLQQISRWSCHALIQTLISWSPGMVRVTNFAPIWLISRQFSPLSVNLPPYARHFSTFFENFCKNYTYTRTFLKNWQTALVWRLTKILVFLPNFVQVFSQIFSPCYEREAHRRCWWESVVVQHFPQRLHEK